MKKRLLFLCSQNKLRSPTAEAVFAGHPAVEVDAAGLNNDAEVPLSEEQVEWADLIPGDGNYPSKPPEPEVREITRWEAGGGPQYSR